MLLDSFLDSQGRRTRVKRHRRGAAHPHSLPVRLLLEHLEDRALPSFITAPGYAVGVHPYALAAADFNGEITPLPALQALSTRAGGEVVTLP